MKTPTAKLHYPALAAALMAVALASTQTIHAQSTWNGASTTGNSWGTAANWVGSTAPIFGNTTDLVFNNLTRPDNDIGSSRTVRSISYGADMDGPFVTNTRTFDGGAAATLTFQAAAGNATLTIDPGATGNLSIGWNGNGTVGGSIALESNLNIVHNGSGNLTFSRGFSGSSGFTKNGTGTLVVSNFPSNTFAGPANFNGGRSIFGNSGNATGDFASASAINLGGGTLEIQAPLAKTISSNLTVSAPSRFVYNNTTNTTRQLLLNTGSMTLDANLTVENISGNTTLDNVINISRNLTGVGNLTVETYNNVNSSSTNFANGRVAFGGNNTGWSGNLLIRQGTAQVFGNSTLGQVNVGTGTIILGETNNTFGAGFSLAASTSGAKTIANNIIVRSGGYRTIRGGSDNTYNLNGTITLEGDLNIHNGLFFTDKRIVLNGNITGPGGLTFTESGNPDFIRLTGNNTYSGPTTIGANATLSLFSASGNAVGDTSAVTLTETGALLAVASNETIGSIASTGSNATISLNTFTLTTGGTNASTTYSGSITGAGSLVKTGTGTLTLAGPSTNRGPVVVSGGTLQVANATALGFGGLLTAAPSTTTVSDGATLDLNGTSISEPLVLSGSGVGGNGSLRNDSGTPATVGSGVVGLTLGGGGGGYSVAPAVVISGTGTGATATASLGLTNSSFTGFSGGDKIYTVAPTITIAGGGGSGATATALLTDGATGALIGFNVTAPGTGYTSAPTITFGSGTSSSGTINGSATGVATQFTVSGLNIVTSGSGYTGTPTYTFSSGNATPGNVLLPSVDLAANSSVGGAGNIIMSAIVTESGGANGLTKVGSGALTLSGNNTYTGTTVVSNGTLELQNSGTSSVSVSSGSTLRFTLNDGTTPIASTSGSLTLAAGSSVSIVGTPNAATTYTLLSASSVTGTPTLSAPIVGFSLVSEGNALKLKPVVTDLTPPVIGSASPASISWGSSYTDVAPTATDETAPANPVVVTSGTVNTAKPGTYTLTYNAQDAAGNSATPVQRTVTVSIANPTTMDANGYSPLMRYALGANSPGDAVEAPVISSTATTLSLTAVVRTDDVKLTVLCKTNTDLTASGAWTTTGVSVVASGNQTGVPLGRVRNIYTVNTGSKTFLRLEATLAP